MLEGFRKQTYYQLAITILSSWKLLLTTLLCIVVIMMSKLPCMQKTGNYSNDWVSFVNDTGFSLACSFIAAYFFYILTVLYPTEKRKKPILAIAKEYLRYARDENQHMLKTICNCSDISDEIIPLFVTGIVTKCEKDNLFVCKTNCFNILDQMHKSDRKMQNVILHADYFEVSELNLLKELLEIIEKVDSFIGDKLWSADEKPYTIWGQSELEQLAKRLFRLYQLTDTLYTQLDKNV